MLSLSGKLDFTSKKKLAIKPDSAMGGACNLCERLSFFGRCAT
jgi:hypothetical protein